MTSGILASTAAPRFPATAAGCPTFMCPLLCAASVRHNSAVAVDLNTARRRVREELFDTIFKVLLARESCVDRGDLAGAIDQKCGGQRVDAAVCLGRHVVAREDAVIHAGFGDVRFHDLPAF